MTNDNNQNSPRYVDESMEGDKNLRPNPEETEQRGTNKPPLSEEEVKESKDEDEDDDEEEEETGEAL